MGRRVKFGIKSFFVKKAVKLLATAIRHGGDIVKEIIRHVDKKAAKAFDKHADEIADELDRIARLPDLTTRIVKEKVYWFCRHELKLSGGTSLQIADGIKRALDILVF